MRLLIIVQARMAASRLPGKVLLPLAGKPLLERMIERLRATAGRWPILVATTRNSEDLRIRTLCEQLDVDVYSGHPTDLLDRHYRAAKSRKADVVVKVPSDCPLVDPAIIDRVASFFSEHQRDFDYVSNLHPPTYPDGNDVEVITFDALEKAWKEATKPFEREHTTPYIWGRPQSFRIGNVTWQSGMNYSMVHRWTIDYPEDYLLIKAVFERLYRKDRPVFRLMEIIDLLHREPQIKALNQEYIGVNWYGEHAHELRTISPDQRRKVI
jgi:spore coat polysaccharide biosynthesis protein SpsF